jgi:hypothetical protein
MDCIRLLLERGADPEIKNKKKLTSVAVCKTSAGRDLLKKTIEGLFAVFPLTINSLCPSLLLIGLVTLRECFLLYTHTHTASLIVLPSS